MTVEVLVEVPFGASIRAPYIWDSITCETMLTKSAIFSFSLALAKIVLFKHHPILLLKISLKIT